MAITYKAFEVDLRYPVTLKVINERYKGNESARLRFLRQAPTTYAYLDAHPLIRARLFVRGGTYGAVQQDSEDRARVWISSLPSNR
jgi:hypothetical protein